MATNAIRQTGVAAPFEKNAVLGRLSHTLEIAREILGIYLAAFQSASEGKPIDANTVSLRNRAEIESWLA